jgi:hypothetical protein
MPHLYCDTEPGFFLFRSFEEPVASSARGLSCNDDRFIDYLLFYVPLKNFSLVRLRRGSFLWEETGAPGENPRVRVGDQPYPLTYNHCRSRGSNSGRIGEKPVRYPDTQNLLLRAAGLQLLVPWLEARLSPPPRGGILQTYLILKYIV